AKLFLSKLQDLINGRSDRLASPQKGHWPANQRRRPGAYGRETRKKSSRHLELYLLQHSIIIIESRARARKAARALRQARRAPHHFHPPMRSCVGGGPPPPRALEFEKGSAWEACRRRAYARHPRYSSRRASIFNALYALGQCPCTALYRLHPTDDASRRSPAL